MRIGEAQHTYSVQMDELLGHKNSQQKMQAAASKSADGEENQDSVTLELSAEGMQYSASNDLSDTLRDMNSDVQSGEETEPQAEAKESAKCMEIARRIAAGGKVPASDAQRLLQYNAQMYMTAVNTADVKEQSEHKKYDSMWSDEKQNSSKNSSDSTKPLSDDMRSKLQDLNLPNEESNIQSEESVIEIDATVVNSTEE